MSDSNTIDHTIKHIEKYNRYQNDPEYRELIKKKRRDRYWIEKNIKCDRTDLAPINPGNRKKFTPEEAKQRKIKYMNEWIKKKLETDPEFKKYRIEYLKKYAQSKKLVV